MVETPALETERLWLKPITLADALAIERRFARWEVVKHLDAHVPWPYPPGSTEPHLRECLEKAAAGDGFYWGLWLKGGPDEVVGRIDILTLDSERDEQGRWRDQRGFWLDPEFAGRGLMFEAAEAVTGFAFRDLGWPRLIMANAAPNIGSRRIKEKQGAKLIATDRKRFVAGEFDREVWILEAEDWLARRA